MGRVSQAQAQEHRKRIVETAARLFRERGVGGVSVADVMAEVGLTPGGFYKQFASKDALVTEAVGAAFDQQAHRLADAGEARDTFIATYLSPGHRDDPGTGCPSAGFGTDLARAEPDADARAAYARGVRAHAAWLQATTGPTTTSPTTTGPTTTGPTTADRTEAEQDAADQDAAGAAGEPGAAALAELSTLVGAIVLARATAGTDLSDRILAAARAQLLR